MKTIYFVSAAILVAIISVFFFVGRTEFKSRYNDQEKASKINNESEVIVQIIPQEDRDHKTSSMHDSTATLQQVYDLSLITSALYAYSKNNSGRYPSTLIDLTPDYTPGEIFPDGEIPLDHGGAPFDYKVSADGLKYKLCNKDLEKGGMECLESE